MTQKGWLARHKMPVSKVRAIVRAQGRLCLRCLSRTRVVPTMRCQQCKDYKKWRRAQGCRNDSA